MKKIFFIFVVVIVAMSFWRMTIKTTSGKYKDKILLRWVTDSNPTRAEQVAEFERLNPDIHIIVDPSAKGKELIQISGGAGPDLLDLDTEKFRYYAKNKALYDFSDLRQKANQALLENNRKIFNDNLKRLSISSESSRSEVLLKLPTMSLENSSAINQYNQAAIHWNKNRTPKLKLMVYQMTKDVFWPAQLSRLVYKNKILAAPTNASSSIIIFNKEIFNHYNVPYPQDGWTTDDFIKTCNLLSHKVPDSNVYETFAMMPIWTPQAWLYLAGGRFYNSDKTKCVLDSPEGKKALGFIGNLWQENEKGIRLSPTLSDSMAGSSNSGGNWEDFGRGKIAMVNAGRWIYCLTGPLFQSGYVQMPHFSDVKKENRGVYFAGRSTAITRDSKHPEAAFKFLMYLLGRDYGRILLNSGDGVSGVRYYRDEEWALFDPEFPEVQSLMLKRIISKGKKSIEELRALSNAQLAGLAAEEWKSLSDSNRKTLKTTNKDSNESTALNSELAKLAEKEWNLLPGSEKEKIKKKVSAMMKMIYNETAKGVGDEINPYISQNLFALASSNIREQVQSGAVKPENWAAELKKQFDRHLSRALNKDNNTTAYRIGNILGIVFITSVSALCLYLLILKKRKTAVAAYPVKKGETLAAFCFLTPNLTGFAMFIFIPVIFSFVMAFTNFNTLTNEIHFVGFNNFVDQMTRPEFWYFLFNTFAFMIGLPISVALSLILALVLNDKLRGFVVYRTIFYLPSVVSGIAIFLLWKWMYNAEYGLVNHVLRTLWISETPNWLAGGGEFLGISFFWAKPALITMSVWMAMGGPNVLLFLSGLSAIPPELYEASDIDGANKWQQFWNVTWPLLSPTTFFIMIMGVIGGLQGGFEMAYAMTQGGPQQSTTTLGYHIYNTAFFEFEIGQAAAIAWVLFFLVFGITLINWKFGEKKVNY